MRYRLMATYLGVPYHAGLGPDGNEVTLFSPGPPPDELGFTAAAGHWRKQVNVADLDALWQSRLVGEYRGEPCLVLDDLGDRLHIAYQGRDSARARQLGYWEIDREVFEVVVARQDITGLTEERVEYPLDCGPVPAVEPGSGGPGRAGGAGPRRRRGATRRRIAALRRRADQPAAGGAAAGPAAGRRAGRQTRARRRREPDSGREPDGRREPDAGRGNAGPEPRGPGYAGADRASSTPDRMAAWHGSPETEPWSEPPRGPAAGSPARGSGAAAVPDEPRSEGEPRTEPRAVGHAPPAPPSRAARRAAGPGAPVGLRRTPQPGRHPARGLRGRRGGAGRHVPGQGGRRLRGVQPDRRRPAGRALLRGRGSGLLLPVRRPGGRGGAQRAAAARHG